MCNAIVQLNLFLSVLLIILDKADNKIVNIVQESLYLKMTSQ